MRSRIGLWGGSHAIRLPKAAVESLGFREGEQVELRIEQGALVVRPGRPRHVLADLLKEAEGLTRPEPIDDAPVGDEWPG